MNIDEMPAGKELDYLLAERVMGWTEDPEGCWLDRNNAYADTGWGTEDNTYSLPFWQPSTNIAHAWTIGFSGWLWHFAEGWSIERQAYVVECILIDAQKHRREYRAWASFDECGIRLTTKSAPVYALARCCAALKTVE